MQKLVLDKNKIKAVDDSTLSHASNLTILQLEYPKFSEYIIILLPMKGKLFKKFRMLRGTSKPESIDFGTE